MKAPTNLSHKVIVEVADYDVHDGMYKNSSDAKALSMGEAQWTSSEDAKDISVKVWRHVNGQWSPQSEELPPHRVLDLSSLIATIYHDVKTHTSRNYRNGQVLSSQSEFSIDVVDDGKVTLLENYFQTNDNVIYSRLKALKNQLNSMPEI